MSSFSLVSLDMDEAAVGGESRPSNLLKSQNSFTLKMLQMGS